MLVVLAVFYKQALPDVLGNRKVKGVVSLPSDSGAVHQGKERGRRARSHTLNSISYNVPSIWLRPLNTR